MNAHGFALVREQQIPEVNSYARLFRHVKTGAELLSLENNDENKVFGITFRTPPRDSTGVAHILEHITLCGSRKYPLKDPFVELIKGSLKTFLNAMTYPDKTTYPVASQNTQDFYNLVDVYLDAVFFPRIARYHFEQEGWHYELEDADRPLAYKGVVYNEMKGAYSSPDSMLYKYIQQSLFPDITYGVDSGGDPTHIPDLTYEQLKQFHDTLYHPSNSRIFFYGDDDPAKRLEIVAAYLDQFERIAPDSAVPLQPPFSAPTFLEQTYAASESNGRKAMLSVNWMLGEVTDLETQMGLGVLNYIMLGTPASPLRKALIDSGLGENVVGGGLGDDLRQLTFSTGLKNIDPDNAGRVETLVLDTLKQLADGAIEQDAVDAAMNTIEFSLRENNTGSFPRGIAIMLGALGGWLHGADPIKQIAFDAPLQALKARIEGDAPSYFGDLIGRFLLDNPHRTTLLLRADPQLGERIAAAERQKLDEVQASLSDGEIQELIRHTAELKELQERPDPPEVRATIPTLTLADLDKNARTIPSAEIGGRAVQTLYHEIFTNGIVYLDLGIDLHALPAEQLPYVPLFGRALLEMGTEAEDYVKLSRRIGRTTGGIHTNRFVSTRRDGETAAYAFLRGKAMPAQTGDLVQIMREVLTTVKLDNRERFRQMALQEKARVESSLVPSGHSYADLRLRARFSQADWANEQMGGISYLFFVRTLVEEIENDWPTVLAALQRIQTTLTNREIILANVTTDAANWQTIGPQIDAVLGDLPSMPSARATWPERAELPDEGLVIPAQVNYVAKGGSLTAAGFAPSGVVSVASNYLRTAYLWEQIRVRGGAYGGFSRYERHTGVFSFLSYRDPNLLRTLQVYGEAGQFLREAKLNQTELTRTIIGVISDLDAYKLPDAKGYTALVRHLTGETDATRQQYRDQVLGTTVADFHALGAALDALATQGAIVAIGGQTAIEQANTERGGFLDVVKVM